MGGKSGKRWLGRKKSKKEDEIEKCSRISVEGAIRKDAEVRGMLNNI